MLEGHIESDRSGSTGSEDTLSDDMLSQSIRRELRSLSSQGFEVKDLGQRNLKGLENPEYIYLMYPHSLASRLIVQQQRLEAQSRAQQQQQDLSLPHPARKPKDSTLTIDTDTVWELWDVSLRLEMLCSTLESTAPTSLKAPETALLEMIKQRGGEVTDRFLINFVEHQISRIEVCLAFSTQLAREECCHTDFPYLRLVSPPSPSAIWSVRSETACSLKQDLCRTSSTRSLRSSTS